MSKGTIIAQALVSAASITNVVADRIYPVIIPQADLMPCLVYYVTSAEVTKSNDRPAGIDRYNFSIQVVGKTYRQIDELAANVRTVLESYSTSTVSNIWFQTEADDFETNSELFVRIMDFEIRCKR